jgi:predicted CopG family antitoxin
MKLKTVSVDLEAFKMLRRVRTKHESYGDVIRRVFAEHADEIDLDRYLADMIANPPQVNTELLRRRQKNPPRSRRPARHAHAI